MKQLWIILAFAVQAMCCGSGWAVDINGPLGPGGGGILGDAGTNPGITDDCQCSYLMVYLSPMCQDLNVGCTITGKVVGITYGGSCDVLLTLRTYPTNVLQFVTNAIVDGTNTEFKFDFLSVTNSCSAEIIETNFVVRGLTPTPEGQFSGLIAELYKCGDTNPCLVYTQKLDVVQLQGISVSPQVAQVNEDVTFTAQMSPTNSGGSILSWSGGGQPATGTGTVFTTRWSTPGIHTVTARCGIATSECGGTTSVNVPVVPSLNLEYNALPEETQPTPNEENPGGFIRLNDNNDDGEAGIDKDRPTTAPELAVADSDLKEVKLSMTPVPTTGIMTLTIPAGIRVWENAKKKSLVANQWNLAVPAEKTAFEALLAGGIWLEGTNSGSGDLKLAYGTACADKIKMTILKVDTIEASSAKASNSPRQFQGHTVDFGDPHASDGADRALIIPYKNVRNADLTVQDFDVTLKANVLPTSITANQLSESWAKVEGPTSGNLNQTDTFEVKYQNPKKGGLYKFEFDLGLEGCAKSGANVHLPLGGPNATAWCAGEANELIATATIIDGIEHVANRTICYLATSATLDWDYGVTAEATQSGDSPCHVYGVNETITIAGVVVSKPKFANFMWGYYCRMFYSGVDWWVQVLLAGSIGTGDTPECWEAYKAGKEWWDGATLETVMKDHGLGMQLSGEQTEKLWPSSDPYIGGKTGPAWFGMAEADLIVYCYYLLGIPLE